MYKLMTSERFGDTLEEMYEAFYRGNAKFGMWQLRFSQILGKLVDAGMLTNFTKKRMEVFLKLDDYMSCFEVISRETDEVVMIDTRSHKQDSFSLQDYISWITGELCNDPIMKKLLCEKNNYEGVKEALNTYREVNSRSLMRPGWVDLYMDNTRVYFTKRTHGVIHLYVTELKEENQRRYPSLTDTKSEGKLVEKDLLDGRLYVSDGTVFVETKEGEIIGCRVLENGMCEHSKMESHIMGQLTDDSLIFFDGDEIVSFHPSRKMETIAKDAYLQCMHIRGNEVYWKSTFRKYDMESKTFDKHIEKKMHTNLKNEKISKDMLWKALLLLLYDFDCMDFEKIGNRLRLAKFYDNTPHLFTIREIAARLSEIEAYCYDRSILKNVCYIEVMHYLMTLEQVELNEKETVDALVNFFEHIEVDPYVFITNNGKVGDCFNIIFGEIDILHDEMADLEDYVDGKIEFLRYNAMMEEIDEKIAELGAELDAELEKCGIMEDDIIKELEKVVLDETERSADGTMMPLED